MLRHKYAVGSVKLHHSVGIGLVQRILIFRQYSGDGLFVYIHRFPPLVLGIPSEMTIGLSRMRDKRRKLGIRFP
jgi:hypothetical protein